MRLYHKNGEPNMIVLCTIGLLLGLLATTCYYVGYYFKLSDKVFDLEQQVQSYKIQSKTADKMLDCDLKPEYK